MSASTSRAARKYSSPAIERPAAAERTAPAPKMRMGTKSGSTSNESSAPPRRSPTVSATPMAPIRLRVGVPRIKVTTKVIVEDLGVGVWMS